jgi:predicted extracellular nuclease
VGTDRDGADGGVTVVTITDVIVTAIDSIGANSKGFWVQQAAQAAANQGVLVFTGATTPAWRSATTST